MNEEEKSVRSSRSWIALLLAGAGIVFCILNVLSIGKDTFCFTSGCALYRDETLFGVSFWWYGVAGFLLIGLLHLVNMRFVAYIVTFAAVLADVFLLLWLAFTLPCISCMIVGLLFLLLFFTVPAPLRFIHTLGRIVVILWVCALTPNIIAVVLEAVPPWPVYGQEKSSAKVFFSPSCMACRIVVSTMADNAAPSTADDSGLESDFALYPLADQPDDLYRIHRMQAALAGGTDLASAIAGLPTEIRGYAEKIDAAELSELKLRLMRNRIFVLRAGARQIPFTLLEGARPELLRADEPSASERTLPVEDDVFEPDHDPEPDWLNSTDSSGSCSALPGQPCNDTEVNATVHPEEDAQVNDSPQQQETTME